MNTPDPEPIDESLLRWRVWSFTGRRDKNELMEYLVELKTESGLNNCTCEHFQNRLRPCYTVALLADVPPERIKIQKCKHIKLTEEAFKELMMHAMLERELQESSI